MSIGVSSVGPATETIDTERLLLRPFRAEDVHSAGQDPEAQRRITDIPVPSTPRGRRFGEDVAMRGPR
jgi:hypothetical protein